MSEKLEKTLLIVLFSTLGLLFASLYWFYDQLPLRTLAESAPGSVRAVENGDRDSSLTLLGDTFSGYGWFRAQAFQADLAKIGIDLRYAAEFDQVVRYSRLNRDDADLILTTLDQYLRHQPQGKIVGLVSRSVGADAMVLNTPAYPRLKSLRDLQQLAQETMESEYQLELMFAGDTASESVLQVIQNKFPTLAIDQLKIHRVFDASESWKLLQDFDRAPVAALLWEPYVTQAMAEGYTVVFSSKAIPDSIISVVVASNRILAEDPETVAAFLAVYYRYIDETVENAAPMQALLATESSLTDQAVASVLSRLDFFTALEAQHWLSQGRLAQAAATLSLDERLAGAQAMMTGLIDAGPIAQAADNTRRRVERYQREQPDLAQRLQGEGTTVRPK
jgi:hypothetical protein